MLTGLVLGSLAVSAASIIPGRGSGFTDGGFFVHAYQGNGQGIVVRVDPSGKASPVVVFASKCKNVSLGVFGDRLSLHVVLQGSGGPESWVADSEDGGVKWGEPEYLGKVGNFTPGPGAYRLGESGLAWAVRNDVDTDKPEELLVAERDGSGWWEFDSTGIKTVVNAWCCPDPKGGPLLVMRDERSSGTVTTTRIHARSYGGGGVGGLEQDFDLRDGNDPGAVCLPDFTAIVSHNKGSCTVDRWDGTWSFDSAGRATSGPERGVMLNPGKGSVFGHLDKDGDTLLGCFSSFPTTAEASAKKTTGAVRGFGVFEVPKGATLTEARPFMNGAAEVVGLSSPLGIAGAGGRRAAGCRDSAGFRYALWTA